MKLFSKKTLVLIAAVALFMAGSSAFAETVLPSDENPKVLGFTYCLSPSFFSSGLTYQQWKGNFGFHVDLDMTFDSEFALIGGIQKAFFQTKHNDVLSSIMFAWADAGTYTDTNTADGAIEIPNFMAGAGIGFEIILFDHFSIPVKVGYTAVFPNDTTVSFSYSGGLMYRF